MAYTETTTKSYGSHLSDSFKSIGTGFVMFILGTLLLFWNEGRAVKTTKSIKEAESVVVKVDDVSSIKSDLNGSLIHASAKALTDDILRDDMFGVEENAIKLKRVVEYYQWVEREKSVTRDKIGGGSETVTTYTYERQWTSSPVNSSAFRDPEYQNVNSTLTTLDNDDKLAANVSFGAYTLPDFIKSSISGFEAAEVKMTDEQLKQWTDYLAKSSNVPQKQVADSSEMNSLVHIRGNVVTFAPSPASPSVGDVRITFTKVLPKEISIIAKVHENTFERYVAKNGKAFSSVQIGKVSAEEMFSAEHASNTMVTWILRFVGIFLVIGGLKALFSILPTLLKVLPFLGNIVGAGVGLVCTVGGGAWSLLVIAIAWLFYRPILGIFLLALAIGGVIWLKKISKKNKAAKLADEAANTPVPPPSPVSGT